VFGGIAVVYFAFSAIVVGHDQSDNALRNRAGYKDDR